ADAATGGRIAAGGFVVSRAAAVRPRRSRTRPRGSDAGRRDRPDAALAARQRDTEAPRDVVRLQRGAGVALARRLQVPAERALQIGRDAIAMLVEACDQVLRSRVAVLCSRFVPPGGERPVFRRPAPEEIL